jgi:transcriptional regulator with XRE-family HTH domain
MADDAGEFNGTLMREGRLALRWNTTRLAHEVGVTELTVRKWEARMSTPSLRHGLLLARTLGVDPFKLAGFSPADDPAAPAAGARPR